MCVARVDFMLSIRVRTDAEMHFSTVFVMVMVGIYIYE